MSLATAIVTDSALLTLDKTLRQIARRVQALALTRAARATAVADPAPSRTLLVVVEMLVGGRKRVPSFVLDPAGGSSLIGARPSLETAASA